MNWRAAPSRAETFRPRRLAVACSVRCTRGHGKVAMGPAVPAGGVSAVLSPTAASPFNIPPCLSPTFSFYLLSI